MAITNEKIVKSSFVKIIPSEGRFKVIDSLTNKQFLANQATVDVINFFAEPRELDEQVSVEAVKSLREKRILIDYSEFEYLLDRRRLYPYSLFGVSEFSEEDAGKIVFLGIPFGRGNGSDEGTRSFPSSFRRFLQKSNMYLSEENLRNPEAIGLSSNDVKLQQLRDAGDLYVHSSETRMQVYDKIERSIKRIGRNNCPFVLGGDHSITLPCIKGLSSHYDDFDVIHIDAHTDTYPNLHDLNYKRNNIHHHGNFVSHCLSLDCIGSYYQYGIRGLSVLKQELEDDKQKICWAHQIKAREMPIQVLEGRPVYITMDIDVLDPSIATGTATPVPNGLTLDDVYYLLDALNIGDKTIIGLDLVEVNPALDVSNTTVQIATQLILKLLNSL